MMGQVSSLMIALDEVSRIGYDSERSMKNFHEQAQSLEASLVSYENVLPELRERLQATLRSLSVSE